MPELRLARFKTMFDELAESKRYNYFEFARLQAAT
jgi:hypothetical protein